MSPVQYLREFISERLMAAAEEIFLKLETTIVQYEVEIDRQRKLLDDNRKLEIKLNTTGVPQQHICKEEEESLAVQLFCNQTSTSGLDLKEPPQEEFGTSQEGELLDLKWETHTYTITAFNEKSNHSDSGFKSDQFPSHSSAASDSRDQEQTQHSDSKAPEPNAESRGCSNHVENADTAKAALICHICGKVFKCKYNMRKHYQIHTGERPYSCKVCGKGVRDSDKLMVHMRTHTGEKPYSCKLCGKSFAQNSSLTVHMKTHTDERPFSCELCGKRFRDNSKLVIHKRSHTGERPYSCKVCWKSFTQNSHLTVHLKTHKRMKPHTCQACGLIFSNSYDMLHHATTHTE